MNSVNSEEKENSEEIIIRQKVQSLKDLCIDKIVYSSESHPFNGKTAKFKDLGPEISRKMFIKINDTSFQRIASIFPKRENSLKKKGSRNRSRSFSCFGGNKIKNSKKFSQDDGKIVLSSRDCKNAGIQCRSKQNETKLKNLVWNVQMVDLSLTNCNPLAVKDWLINNCRNLTDMSFMNCKLTKPLFLTVMEKYGRQLRSLELEYKQLNNFKDCISLIGMNCVNLLKFTIWNCKVLDGGDLKLLDKVFLQPYSTKENFKVGYNYCKTLKVITFAGDFRYNQEMYKNLIFKLLFCYAENLELTNLLSKDSSVSYLIKEVARRNKPLKLRKFGELCPNDKNFTTILKVAKLLPNLEEAQIRLEKTSSYQKRVLINSLNKNIQVLKIFTSNNVNFILQCGRRFRELHT